MKSAEFPDRSLSPTDRPPRFSAEAAVVMAPFVVCIGVISSLPWIAG